MRNSLKRAVIIAMLALVLAVGTAGSALAAYDPWGEFTPVDEWNADTPELGDESVPLYILGGAALLALGGVIFFHRKRAVAR